MGSEECPNTHKVLSAICYISSLFEYSWKEYKQSYLSEEVQTNLSDIELYRIYCIVCLLLENHCVTSKLAFCN